MRSVRTADKGTATFSDYANAISHEYGFWLDDAFASGGSVGYDHKKMAITARGAWESVKRHFSEMGIDTQSQDFTVVGVGDMSGDVFDKVKKELEYVPEVMECHLVSGDFDYLIKARLPEMNKYRQLLGEILKRLPASAESRSYVVMEEIKETLYLAVDR